MIYVSKKFEIGKIHDMDVQKSNVSLKKNDKMALKFLANYYCFQTAFIS